MRHILTVVLVLICATSITAQSRLRAKLTKADEPSSAAKMWYDKYSEERSLVEYLHQKQEDTHCISHKLGGGWSGYTTQVCVYTHVFDDSQMLAIWMSYTEPTYIVMYNGKPIYSSQGTYGSTDEPDVFLPQLEEGSYEVLVATDDYADVVSITFEIQK